MAKLPAPLPISTETIDGIKTAVSRGDVLFAVAVKVAHRNRPEGASLTAEIQCRRRKAARTIARSAPRRCWNWQFAAAMSCLPSPSKSPTASEMGNRPDADIHTPQANAARYHRRSASRHCLNLQFAAARSCLPSPLKSPTATDRETSRRRHSPPPQR